MNEGPWGHRIVGPAARRRAGATLRRFVGLLAVLTVLAVLASLTGEGGRAAAQRAAASPSASQTGDDDASDDDDGDLFPRIVVPVLGGGDGNGAGDSDADSSDANDDDGTIGGAADGPSFKLTSYECTPGNDAELADRLAVASDQDRFFDDDLTVEELREICAYPAEPIAFTLSNEAAGVSDELLLGGDERVTFVWSGLPAETTSYTLRAEMAATDGDPVIRCGVASDPPGTTSYFYATDGEVIFSVGAESSTTCDWFRVDLAGAGGGAEATESDATDVTDVTEVTGAAATPVGNAGETDDAEDDAGASAITLLSHTCDLSDDPGLAERIAYQIEHWTMVDPELGIALDELREVCEPTSDPIAFAVTNFDTGDADVRELGGPDGGEPETWDATEGVGYTIEADEPEGYGEPLVFCDVIPDGQTESVFGLSPKPLADGVLGVGLGTGILFSCEWFHVLGGEAASTAAAVTLLSHTCDVSDDPALAARIAYQIEHWTRVDPELGIALDELREVCEPSPELVAFTVTDGETGTSDERELGGPDGDEPATWDLTANVGYTIDADEPDGYGEPLVFCAIFDAGETESTFEPSPAPMTDGMLFSVVGAGITQSCEWFNVDPGDDAAAARTPRGGDTAVRAVPANA